MTRTPFFSNLHDNLRSKPLTLEKLFGGNQSWILNMPSNDFMLLLSDNHHRCFIHEQ